MTQACFAEAFLMKVIVGANLSVKYIAFPVLHSKIHCVFHWLTAFNVN